MKIAACVVLYNPDDNVIDNINSYFQAVDKVIIIDNSESANNKLAKQWQDKVSYIALGKNLGIAKALNIGCETALKEGYDWVLTMDQDSFFSDKSFFEIVRKKVHKNVAIYAASYTNEYDRWVKNYDQDFDEIHFIITSANLLNLSAWKQVNGFEEKLFIDEVDHDFCLKLRRFNYTILSSKCIFLKHFVGEISDKSHNIKQKLNLHQPIRYYYIARNGLYLCKKYFFTDIKFALQRLLYLVKALAKIILLYPDKLRYLKFYLTGVKDFFLSRYGKLR
jgi:rhamnosyltransferase